MDNIIINYTLTKKHNGESSTMAKSRNLRNPALNRTLGAKSVINFHILVRLYCLRYGSLLPRYISFY